MNKRVFTESEAADYLAISPHTLRKQRSDGERENYMPIVPFIQIGRSVKYVKDDLDKYIDDRLEESRVSQRQVLLER